MTEPKNVNELLKQRARLDAELERYQRMVTVMFTDIAGSTRYFDEHGDLAGMAMLQEVNDVLQPQVGEHKGIVVKTIGDAIMAYFENPIEAVRCGIEMQRALEEANQKRSQAQQLSIRVALNLGVGLLKDNDVFGDVVNVCSRIEHETKAGKIGVSPSVVEAISTEKDVACRKIGEVTVRGKAKPMELYEVLWRGQEIEEFKAAPPQKMSGEQLAMATGTRLGLDDEVRKAIAAAVKGKAQASKAPAIEKKQFVLVEILPDRSLGKRFPLSGETMVVGREKGDITFPQDSLLSREHSVFSTLGGALYVEDLESANGTFVRIRGQHDLQDEDIILLGRQMFRFQLLAKEEEEESKGKGKGKGKKGKEKEKEKEKDKPTDQEEAPILAELIRIGKGGEEGDRFPLVRGENVVGRTQGTYTFPDDRYLSRIHARFKIHEGRSVLEDMKSTNGSFARIRERHLLDEEDTVLVGSQFLRVLAE